MCFTARRDTSEFRSRRLDHRRRSARVEHAEHTLLAEANTELVAEQLGKVGKAPRIAVVREARRHGLRIEQLSLLEVALVVEDARSIQGGDGVCEEGAQRERRSRPAESDIDHGTIARSLLALQAHRLRELRHTDPGLLVAQQMPDRQAHTGVASRRHAQIARRPDRERSGTRAASIDRVRPDDDLGGWGRRAFHLERGHAWRTHEARDRRRHVLEHLGQRDGAAHQRLQLDGHRRISWRARIDPDMPTPYTIRSAREVTSCRPVAAGRSEPDRDAMTTDAMTARGAPSRVSQYSGSCAVVFRQVYCCRIAIFSRTRNLSQRTCDQTPNGNVWNTGAWSAKIQVRTCMQNTRPVVSHRTMQ